MVIIKCCNANHKEPSTQIDLLEDMEKQFTFAQIRKVDKDHFYIAVHEKIYDVHDFVSSHPGGEEVLKNVRGEDATHPFEDTGHSEEAREILDGFHVGSLKRIAGDPDPQPVHNKITRSESNVTSPSRLSGHRAYGLATGSILLALSYAGYTYLRSQSVM